MSTSILLICNPCAPVPVVSFEFPFLPQTSSPLCRAGVKMKRIVKNCDTCDLSCVLDTRFSFKIIDILN